MLTGEVPWADQFPVEKNEDGVDVNEKHVLKHLRETDSTPTYPEGISEKCSQFLDACLQIDPNKRERAKDLLKH